MLYLFAGITAYLIVGILFTAYWLRKDFRCAFREQVGDVGVVIMVACVCILVWPLILATPEEW
jgi:hypothetical protein